MSTVIAFTVPGPVRGKGRPRIVKHGKFTRLATDEKTASYENRVALAAHEAMRSRGMLEGPLTVVMSARLCPAASVPKKTRAAMLSGNAPPTKKPDLDNTIKALMDGLNGVAWRDDVQVVSITATKSYAETPGLDVVIRPYEPQEIQIPGGHRGP
jgi:Holliday junction resolvase RusA-like endonuclease